MTPGAGTPAPDVVVVGNGAAGTMVVIGLLRAAGVVGTPLGITWVGDGPPALGVAYATSRPWHRLNVPADAVSLDAAHRDFPDWLVARGVEVDAAQSARDAEFAPRWAFGAYLAETLRDVRAGTDPALVSLTVEVGRATDLGSGPDGVRVGLADGREVHAGRAVLAPGPFPSPRPPGATDAALAHPALVTDPWSEALEADPPPRTAVLVGTGLTMVDAALSLARRHPHLRMLAVSRSGLLPRSHSHRRGAPVDPPVAPGPGPDLGVDDVVAAVEDLVAREPGRWRDVVDGLPPVTRDLWRSLSPTDRARFLAEHARRWEIHRHRMAPAVADELDRLRRGGRLEVRAARVARIDAVGPGLSVTLDADGVEETVHADRVVSCIGAQEDVSAVDDPLVASMLRSGAARPHPSGLGFDTDDDGALRPDDDRERRLYTLGATRRGDLYETTGLAEIREQATALAELLLIVR